MGPAGASIINSIRFLCLLCVCCSPGVVTAETRDLILIAGQSNAVGYDTKASELPADAADKDILFWWRTGDPPPDEHDSTSGGKWTHLQSQPKGNPDHQFGNFANADGGFGPEIGLARALYAKGNKQLAIVKAAWNGTSMAQAWNPADPGDGGSCYRALVSETKAAMAAARSQGITPRLRAFVWVQGESDASATAAPSYEKALGDMIAALRKDLDSPQLIALLAVNTKYGGGTNPFMPKIVEAQQALAAKDPRCAYVDTASATIANAAHFDSAGTLDVGRRFAEALLKTEAKVAAPPSDASFPGKKSEWRLRPLRSQVDRTQRGSSARLRITGPWSIIFLDQFPNELGATSEQMRELRATGTTVPDIIRQTGLSKASVYLALG